MAAVGGGPPLLHELRAARRRPRIALFRGTPGVGDLLCAVPSWRALRAAVPDAQITLIAQPQLRDLGRRYVAYVDDLLSFPGFPGLPDAGDDVRATTAFLADAQARRFDLVVQQHGTGRITNLIAVLLGGRRIAGFQGEDAYVPGRGVFLPYPEQAHEIHRHLALMALLGAPSRGDELELPVTDQDRTAAARLTPGTDALAVVHPGAKDGGRRWPVASFAAAGRALARRGLRVVVTGSARERPLADCLAETIGGSAVSLAGATDIGALAALVDRAAVVISNDTGVAHVAVARRTPSVVVTPPGLGEDWLPLDRRSHRVVAGTSGPAAPEAVIAAAADLLGSSRPPRVTASAGGS